MTYRELLKLYKQGRLDEEKKRKVEADIEKQDAISEYLYMEDAIPNLLNPEDAGEAEGAAGKAPGAGGGAAETAGRLPGAAWETREDAGKPTGDSWMYAEERRFAQTVNRTVRRAFIKMGTAVGVVVLVIVLFVQFLLPELVSGCYYNPGKILSKAQESYEETNQMSRDMAVYTELFIPGYRRDNVSVTSRGYGNYDICINQNTSYNGIFTNISGKIEKNRLTLYNTNVLNPLFSNAFEWSTGFLAPSKPLSKQITDGGKRVQEDGTEIITTCAAGSPEDAAENLEELDSSEEYVAYVTLDRILPYQEFIELIEQYDGLADVWCAPCTDKEESSMNVENIGFCCYPPGSTMAASWDEEKYPYLQIWNASLTQEQNEENEIRLLEEEVARTHFISLLSYMRDQKRFCRMMDIWDGTLDSAVRYLENNKLEIYGFAAVADKETLLKLNEAEEVYVIGTNVLR